MRKSSKPQHVSHWVRLMQEQVERAREEQDARDEENGVPPGDGNRQGPEEP